MKNGKSQYVSGYQGEEVRECVGEFVQDGRTRKKIKEK